jgi:hypothetical protein
LFRKPTLLLRKLALFLGEFVGHKSALCEQAATGRNGRDKNGRGNRLPPDRPGRRGAGPRRSLRHANTLQ